MVIIDIESNTSVGGLTVDPAGMHCPSWDDAFVSSVHYIYRKVAIKFTQCVEAKNQHFRPCRKKICVGSKND